MTQHCFLGLSILFLFIIKDVFTLKDVILLIEPKVVRRHGYSILRCSYDLENANLYTVKWYRGTHEFYRFTPSEHPPSKVFPLPEIDVDVNNSNQTQVLLRNIQFKLSGNFSCEVTTTEEPISTKTAIASMLVVELPQVPPKIQVGREVLDYGDILRANCSCSQSRPPATLKFILNNITVARSKPLPEYIARDTYDWSDLHLELVLTAAHFDKGRLILQCVAQIADIYHEVAELALESARDPIPERVSALSSANFHEALRQTTLVIFAVIFVICHKH